MLDQALEKIPDKVTKYCAYARWINLISPGKAIKSLQASGVEMSSSLYTKHCNKAVDFIYSEINGERAGVKNLLELILQGE